MNDNNKDAAKSAGAEMQTETALPTKKDNAKKNGNVNEKAKEITTKEAYFLSLRLWAKQAQLSHNAMAMFPYYLMNSYPQLFPNPSQQLGNVSYVFPFANLNAEHQQQQQQPLLQNGLRGGGTNIEAQPVFNTFRILDEQAQADIINRNGGIDYIVAPFWKRVMAESIDWAILLLLKIIMTYLLIQIFDVDIGFDINQEIKTFEGDELVKGFLELMLDFLTFSSDLLLIEMVTKLFVCFYEAFWTTFNNGATPGKSLMKIHIQYVEAVLPLEPPQPAHLIFQPRREPLRALIYPGEIPSIFRSFWRAFIKNLAMTVLFPMIIMIFLKNNRTPYDIITKTIVVENRANGNLNQRGAQR